MTLHKKTLQTPFEKDTYEGLTATPKYLLSKYIYDKKGDKLFQDIMNLPEYYLTNCEFSILENHKAAIAAAFDKQKEGFDLLELGAGDGKKTKILLQHLLHDNYPFKYIPIDISQNALDGLASDLKKNIPQLDVQTERGDYFQVLEKLNQYSKRKKVILVLGSNIGNLLHTRAIAFLKKIQEEMLPEDMLFMGFDQKKHPQTILNAYNDPTGVTAAFNKNHLHRINQELEADFIPDNFMHWESYNPETGTAKSFLISTKKQEVSIKKLGLNISFAQWETIHTEISQKYDDNTVEWLAEQAGLQIETSFTDTKNYYKNYIFRKH